MDFFFSLTVDIDSHIQKLQISIYTYCFFERFLTQIASDTTRLFLRTLSLKNLHITAFHLGWGMLGGGGGE